MAILLFALGIVAVLGGLGMLGFGIPINEFGLGNTLIGSGVTALVGGFVVIGLAAAVTELRRIAALSSGRPAPRATRADEPIEPMRAPRAAPARPPMPTRSGFEPPGRPAPRGAEPRPAAGSPVEAPPEVQVARPSPRMPSSGRPEPPVIDEPEEVTLSPHVAPRGRPYAPVRPDVEPEPEPNLHVGPPASPDRAGMAETFATPRMPPTSRRSAPEPVVERNMFASLWESRSELIAPEQEATAPAADEEPAPPPPIADTRPPRVASAPLAGAAEPRPVSVLKSGVVDGMAYTLYSDGSIEAELPEGTVRFESINALRDHLDQHS